MSAPNPLNQSYAQLLTIRPWLADFFAALPLGAPGAAQSPEAWIQGLAGEALAEAGLTRAGLLRQLGEFMAQMEAFSRPQSRGLRCLTLLGGRDKSGSPEELHLEMRPGDVLCIVGPTGSGKSRLLGDIETLAQGDTPTGRRLLLDGMAPDEEARFSGERPLVAQLSQNMNFVMDLSVAEFIALHAESRLHADVPGAVQQVFELAVGLAGEPFLLSTAVTALSGGQSRALMIADVACLSDSPVVLIDEIENAGVDRRRALDLLVKKEKIVLLATHDPLLALLGERRLILRNGAVASVLATSPKERESLLKLDRLDRLLGRLREQVRAGERIDFDPSLF